VAAVGTGMAAVGTGEFRVLFQNMSTCFGIRQYLSSLLHLSHFCCFIEIQEEINNRLSEPHICLIFLLEFYQINDIPLCLHNKMYNNGFKVF
jgi:hypothetical protein